MTKKKFLELAEKKGLEIHKNNKAKKAAKSPSKICGRVKVKYPAPIEELIPSR